MRTNQEFIDKWLPFELKKCPLFIAEKLGQDAIYQLTKNYVQQSYDYCTDENLVQSSFDYCKVEGSVVKDFNYRSLTTPLGDCITSIRFIGGDLTKPAVFLMHQDFALDTPDKIRQVGAIIRQEFDLFKPQRMRWFSTKWESELIDNHDFIAGDLIYVSAFLEDLRIKSFPQNYERIQLQLSTHLDWYPLYENAYKNIYAKWPLFVEMAQMESKEALQELMDNELLFDAFVDGEWAGLIGVDTDKHQFFNGYVVYEELLIERFRGQQLAVAVQRHLIEKLDASENKQLFGTIHYENKPSYKTAYGTGRQFCGMYVFAELGM